MQTGVAGPQTAETVLYFVRHGETDENRKGIVQGSGIDSVLNERGRMQAQALAKRLADDSLDTVYASTMQRAQQTAEIAAAPHEPISKTYLRDLREISWGVFEGQSPSPTTDAALDDVKNEWQNGQYDSATEAGESARDVQVRALRAVDHIMTRAAGRTVLVVAHGRYLRALLASILEDYTLADMHRLGHSNTCVNRVVHRDGAFRADTLNCTAHLSTETVPVEP